MQPFRLIANDLEPIDFTLYYIAFGCFLYTLQSIIAELNYFVQGARLFSLAV